jgi:hypothetical protein
MKLIRLLILAALTMSAVQVMSADAPFPECGPCPSR